MNDTKINTINKIRSALQKHSQDPNEKLVSFFKTGPGEYAEHDRFLGIPVPALRKIAKQHRRLTLEEIQALLYSEFNEERLLALLILVDQYQTADKNNEHSMKNTLYQYYFENRAQVNNWNLVDASAHLIVGAHLYKKSKNPLLILVKSPSLWDRRIAIVSTWYFIRQQALTWTFKLAKILLNDDQDLMHKSTGWMLREAGKRDEGQLLQFLDQYANRMPRTMLRYSIERLSEEKRADYLQR
jgi:3-methyladenine DNA glycosylase AlkD